MLAVAGLRGAVTILGHAGHGNLLGLQSSVTFDGVSGHDLRADHEAVHACRSCRCHRDAPGRVCGGAGVLARGSRSGRIPDHDDAADPGGRLRGTRDTRSGGSQARPNASAKVRSRARQPLLRPEVIVPPGSPLPDIADAGPVIAAVKEYDAFLNSRYTSLWAHGDPTGRCARQARRPRSCGTHRPRNRLLCGGRGPCHRRGRRPPRPRRLRSPATSSRPPTPRRSPPCRCSPKHWLPTAPATSTPSSLTEREAPTPRSGPSTRSGALGCLRAFWCSGRVVPHGFRCGRHTDSGGNLACWPDSRGTCSRISR